MAFIKVQVCHRKEFGVHNLCASDKNQGGPGPRDESKARRLDARALTKILSGKEARRQLSHFRN